VNAVFCGITKFPPFPNIAVTGDEIVLAHAVTHPPIYGNGAKITAGPFDASLDDVLDHFVNTF
jgi:hypothetical protein